MFAATGPRRRGTRVSSPSRYATILRNPATLLPSRLFVMRGAIHLHRARSSTLDLAVSSIRTPDSGRTASLGHPALGHLKRPPTPARASRGASVSRAGAGRASASCFPSPDPFVPGRRVIGHKPWRSMSVAPRQAAGRDSVVSVPYPRRGETGCFGHGFPCL